MQNLSKEEIEKLVAIFFGFTPASRLPKDAQVKIVDVGDAIEMEEAKKLKIRWDNHIGGETKIARLTPLDILHYLGWKNTRENYEKAVEIMKYLAKKNSLILVKIGDRYLLLNPRRRG